MPRLAANLTYLFTELEFLGRFEAAADAGFRAVEYQFPYAHDKQAVAEQLREHNLEMVLINLPAGDAQAGDAGVACDPNRRGEFRAGVEQGIDFALALGCRQLNCLAGIAPEGVPPGDLFDTFVENLRFAADRFSRAGLRLLIEPINTRDRPGFYLSRTNHAVEIIDAVGAENLFLQFDVYHTQIMQGDIVHSFEANRHRIRHVQIADTPGRHEPGTGELNYPFILRALDTLGYEGWVSCEYAPSTSTVESLGWARGYLEQS
jgi:hydroxypyruvate isomerase